jgi:hypothetical protein
MSRKAKFTPEEKEQAVIIILKEINLEHRYVENYVFLQELFRTGP